MSMWREAADIQTAEMLKLPVPEADKITVVTKPSDFQRAMVEDLGERADLVRTRQVEPRQDNMLKITSDGRKLALDQRLADPSLPDDPESKINSCVKNVLQVWRDTAEIKDCFDYFPPRNYWDILISIFQKDELTAKEKDQALELSWIKE